MTTILWAAFATALAFQPGADGGTIPPFTCPVTGPNGRGLRGEGHLLGNHGDGAGIATQGGGKIVFEPGGPGCVASNGSLLIKWPWWRGVKGQVSVRGRSLDGKAGAVKAAILPYGETGFQPSALVFPSPGCWEVTGEVAESSISFVVAVEKVAGGPAPKCEALFPKAALRGVGLLPQ